MRIVILGSSSERKKCLYSKCMVYISKNKRVPLSHNGSGTRLLVDKGANTNFLLYLFVK